MSLPIFNIDNWRPLNARVQTLALRSAGVAEPVGGESANPAASFNLTMVDRSAPQCFTIDLCLGQLGEFFIGLFLFFEGLFQKRN